MQENEKAYLDSLLKVRVEEPKKKKIIRIALVLIYALAILAISEQYCPLLVGQKTRLQARHTSITSSTLFRKPIRIKTLFAMVPWTF